MLKNLAKDSIVYGIANAVQKLGPFVIIPLVIRNLGQDAFKIYDVSFVCAYVFAWVAILGQDSAGSILYFDERKTRFNKKQVVAYSLFIQLASLAFLFCVFLPFAGVWSNVLFEKDKDIAYWFPKALLVLPGYIVLNHGLNVLLWQKRKMSYVLLCFVQTICSIGSVVVAVKFLQGNIATLFYALIGSISFTALIGLLLIRKYAFVSLLPLQKTLLKKLVWIGFPFTLTSLFHQLLPSIDRYFLIQFNYSHTLAFYALAAKIGALMNFCFSAFTLAFLPYSLSKLNKDDAEKEISGLFRLVSVAAFFLVSALLLFKNQLILFFADASYLQSANLLPYFFFGWVFDFFTYFSLLGIYRSQKSFLLLILFVLVFIVISVSNVLLIPKLGLYGAAVSFCLAKATLFFVSLIWLRKHFHLQIHAPSFWLSFLLAVGCSYLIYVLPLAMNLLVLFLMVCLGVFYFRKKIHFLRNYTRQHFAAFLQR